MKPIVGYSIAALAGILVGFLARGAGSMMDPVAVQTQRPAYLIVSAVEPEDPSLMRPYQEASGPLGREMAGAQALGFAPPGQVEVLEGAWNLPGLLLVERFNSMELLRSYWSSPEYTEVKKLREGLAEVNFIIAIDGVE